MMFVTINILLIVFRCENIFIIFNRLCILFFLLFMFVFFFKSKSHKITNRILQTIL